MPEATQPNLPATVGPWRVFISHTGELAGLPTPESSYVQRAKRAVVRADHQAVEMADFPGFHVAADSLIRERLATCQVYVGIIGFRWGSANATDETRSYTETEYDLAGDCGLSRHLFLLDESSGELGATLDELGRGEEGWPKQRAFRARLAHRIVKMVGSPAALELEVARALGDITTAFVRERTAGRPSASESPALATWRRKRDFLNTELAKQSDASARFSTMEAIADAESWIARLEAER